MQKSCDLFLSAISDDSLIFAHLFSFPVSCPRSIVSLSHWRVERSPLGLAGQPPLGIKLASIIAATVEFSSAQTQVKNKNIHLSIFSNLLLL